MSGVFPHALIVDVELMTDVEPNRVQLLGQDGLGAIANRLGPVLVWAEGKQQLLDWASTSIGLAWLQEIRAGGNAWYPILGDLVESAQLLDKCGVRWGKTIFTSRPVLKTWGGMIGCRVFDSFENFEVNGGCLVDEHGVLGEEGARSWRQALNDLTGRNHQGFTSQFGQSLAIHDFHCVSAMDIAHCFGEHEGHPSVVKNVSEILDGLSVVTGVKQLLISTHLCHQVKLKKKYAKAWLDWEQGGWIEWIKSPEYSEDAAANDKCPVSFRLKPSGMAQLRYVFSQSLESLGHDGVDVHLLGLNVSNKQDGHPRFLFTEFLYGKVDPSWSLFDCGKKGSWECEFRSSFWSLRDDGHKAYKSQKKWGHYVRQIGRAFNQNSGHLAIDSEGGMYSDLIGWEGFPFVMWDFIAGMSARHSSALGTLLPDSDD